MMSALTASRRGIDDPDVFWIAAAGRQLLHHGSLPRENFFSFTAPHAPWVMHEWLLGPVYALGLGHLGPTFFALLAALTVLAMAALLLFATPGEAQGKVLAAALFLPLFGVHLISARPMVLALLPAAAMLGLAFSPRFGPKCACQPPTSEKSRISQRRPDVRCQISVGGLTPDVARCLWSGRRWTRRGWRSQRA